MKVRYLYSGSRKDKFKGIAGVDYPDTQFYGLNHLSKFGISADYKEWSDVTKSRFWDAILGFRIKHLLLYPFSRSQDVVFGSSLLFLMVFKKLFKTKTKFVLLNIGIMRTLAVNKKNKIKHAFIRWLLSGFDGVVCLARLQKEYLEEKFPSLRGKVFFVPLGVDTRYHQPVYENRKTYFLSVGRDNGRDYQTVIDTARLMPEREFHIACSKRNLAGVDSIPPNVKIFYDFPFSKTREQFQEAGLLLLITHDDSLQDGSDCSGQTVLLEAMANGLPIIVSRKKYLADYVADKKEAVFVDFYDPFQIKAAAVALMGDPGERGAMALRARARVEAEFSTERMAENLATVFTRIAESKNG